MARTNHFECDICHRILNPTGLVQQFGPSDPLQSSINLTISSYSSPGNFEVKLGDVCDKCTKEVIRCWQEMVENIKEFHKEK